MGNIIDLFSENSTTQNTSPGLVEPVTLSFSGFLVSKIFTCISFFVLLYEKMKCMGEKNAVLML